MWVIDRTHFKQILMKTSEAKISEYLQYLDRVNILNPLLKDIPLKLPSHQSFAFMP